MAQRERRANAADDASSALWREGTHFGRYQVASRLAEGGMADVWRAYISGAEGFIKQVAIKTVKPELAHSLDVVRMFISEATIAARFNHPGLVQVFDFGELDGRHFIVMELIPGRSLRQVSRALRQQGRRLPRRFILGVLAAISRALGYAHTSVDEDGELGFVHGDVSPENVMMSSTGAAKLIDFGAASTRRLPPPEGKLIGKLPYVAPERMRGRAADSRADVYALGMMMCEYLLGGRPARGVDARQMLSGAATRMQIPAAVLAIAKRALSPDPADRHAHGDELADELVAVMETELGETPLAATEHEVWQLLRTAEGELGQRVCPISVTPPRLRVVPAAPDLSEALAPTPVAGDIEADTDCDDDAEPFAATSTSTSTSRAGPAAGPGPSSDFGESEAAAEAARCFDQGLDLVARGQLEAALLCWSHAAELNPERRSYRANIARLTQRIAERSGSTVHNAGDMP